MTNPLMMIGPGGDYVTRFDVKGDRLIKTRPNATQGYDRDAESSGNGAGYTRLRGWLPGRGKKTRKPADRPQQDRFEHTEPALPATYGRPGLAELQNQFAMLQAIEHWFTGQAQELDKLAAVQTVTEAQLARQAQLTSSSPSADDDQARVRVIRWNGGTMSLPVPAAEVPAQADTLRQEPTSPATPTVPSPTPCYTIAEQLNPAPLQRSSPDDQPEPDAQADENPHDDSRHPALQRLFADDARARRSFRRVKGHGLRARRSADQKGLPDPGCQQGALFGAVA